MTTIHAVPRGTNRDSVDPAVFALTLFDKDKCATEYVAPLAELKQALKESGGIGRLELILGNDPSVRHAIVKEVKQGSEGEVRQHLIAREVDNTSVVRMSVPIVVGALPVEIQMGWATALQRLKHVVVRGPLGKIPSVLSADLSPLGMGHAFRTKDLELPEGVELVTPPDLELFVVKSVKAE